MSIDWKRPNKRIKFTDDDPKPAIKPLNKKKVFSDSDDEGEKVEWEESHYQKHEEVFELYQLPLRDLFWETLTIQGPYPKIIPHLDVEIVANRRLVRAIREISLAIYTNAVDYKTNYIPNIREPERWNFDGVMSVVEKMCGKVFRFEKDGVSISLYDAKILQIFRSILNNKCVTFDFGLYPETLTNLEFFFKKQNVSTTQENMRKIRTQILTLLCTAAHSLLSNVFQMTTDRERTLRFNGLRKQRVPNARSAPATLVYVYRDSPFTSLWVLIPCEEKARLLFTVFDYRTVQSLPQNLRQFLQKWMVGVRKRMRKQLKNGEMKEIVESFFFPCTKKCIQSTDARLGIFVSKIVENVVNSKSFKLFGSDWKEYMLTTIKRLRQWTPRSNEMNKVAEKMNPDMMFKLSSLLPSRDELLLESVVVQLLRFVIHLALCTIRYALVYKNHTIKFTGVYDKVVTDFEEFEDEEVEVKEEEEVVPPRTVPQMQVIKPRLTLLPTPVLPDDFNPTVPPPLYQPPTVRMFPTTPAPIPAPAPVPSFNPEQKPTRQDLEVGKKSFFVYTPSLQEPTPVQKIEANLSSEVTEEELQNARALRTPSVVSGTILNRLDDDEDVPKKWVDAYRLTLEWNQDLKDELERVKARLERLS